ncbi:MAG: four helix bundle protein [Planctomycetota bacterium]|nr:four helix bundle protein [Planctomycetota bacterium]
MPEDFDFENLTVYQKALDYIDFVYQISEKFPDSERFGFTNNFRRAAQSIALNIGEGSGGTKSEFKMFLKISRRSVRECVVATTISKRRGYITIDEEKESRKRCIELSKMLSGLINSV